MAPPKSTIKFKAAGQSQDLVLSVLLDDDIHWQGAAGAEPIWISVEFDDVDGDHRLQWRLSGKTQDHTQVDVSGNILSDCVISISNITIDDINIDQMVWQLARYAHDFNGAGPQITDKFYGTMGCNGTATLEFTTPIYLWLLEHM